MKPPIKPQRSTQRDNVPNSAYRYDVQIRGLQSLPLWLYSENVEEHCRHDSQRSKSGLMPRSDFDLLCISEMLRYVGKLDKT